MITQQKLFPLVNNSKELVIESSDLFKSYGFWEFYHEVPLENLEYIKFPGRGQITDDDCGNFIGAYSCKCHAQRKALIRTCMKLDCPVCYQKGVERSAKRITTRLTKAWHFFKNNGVPIKYYHRSFNTRWEIKTHEQFRTAKKKLITILKKEGLSGTLFFHPYRRHHQQYRMVYSPHFHFVGVGKLVQSDKFFQKYGFTYKTVKNKRIGRYYIGNTEQMYFTIRYILSHAGYFNASHVNTWFGNFAYNKLKRVGYEVVKTAKFCERCMTKLGKIVSIPVRESRTPEFGIEVIYNLPIEIDFDYVLCEKVETYTLEFQGDIKKFSKNLNIT